MQKYVFFDFDGTLADTLDLVLKFGEEVSKEFSLRPIAREEFKRHSMREALRLMGFPTHKLPEFVLRVKTHIRQNIDSVLLFPDIADMLKDINRNGFRLVVLSSNSKENIEHVLQTNGLVDQVSGIISDSSVFGKHKVIARALKRLNLSRDNIIYVGDEVRDIEACDKIRVPIIAVSWGWDDKDRLAKTGCRHIADNTKDLERLLAEVSSS